MSRYIDADALIADLEHDIATDTDIILYEGTDLITRNTTQFDKDCKQNAIDLILRTPTADVVESKRGEWQVYYDEDSPQDGIWECSACNYIRLADDITPMNFCPNCGARMVEE